LLSARVGTERYRTNRWFTSTTRAAVPRCRVSRVDTYISGRLSARSGMTGRKLLLVAEGTVAFGPRRHGALPYKSVVYEHDARCSAPVSC
jgi:hypothetical protein